jgi:hypothetical protein
MINLNQPLSAMDTLILSKGLPFQDVSLKASLNRDIWVSGMSLFVDLQIHNRTLKIVNKVILTLERTITIYDHPAAQIEAGLYRQSRLPDRMFRKTVATNTVSKSKSGWRGIPPRSKEIKTWMLDLPTGLATINTGKLVTDLNIKSLSRRTKHSINLTAHKVRHYD